VLLKEHFNILVIAWMGLAVLLFPLLLKVRAPYGRHVSRKWGPAIDNRLGWFIMELPSLVLITVLFLTGNKWEINILWLFFMLWFVHYFNRIFIFPFRTRTKGKKIPVLVVLFALFFNLVNGFLNGYWLGYLAGSPTSLARISRSVHSFVGQSPGQGAGGSAGADLQIRDTFADYYGDWLTDPRFIIGISLFITGFIINQVSDNHLIHLRNGKQSGYSIPHHPLFKYISCPNFAGEIIEWTGFAIMTWSLPGLSFAIWTAVNLIPRALHHHRWYRETFPDYPAKRNAVIPYIL